MSSQADVHADVTEGKSGWPGAAAAVASGAFAAFAYLAFLGVTIYAIAFLADTTVPRTVDHGGPHAGGAAAAVIDVLLLTLFAVAHSVMARPAFKAWWTKIVPPHLERSFYVLVASMLLALTFWQWRPIRTDVWHIHGAAGEAILWTVYGIGWALVVAMTYAIDHFELAGLSQVARFIRGRQQAQAAFKVPLPYRIVRHPMMTGFFIAFLATPYMSVGHLVFAVVMCAYIAIGVWFEERDLNEALPEYAEYAARTPQFFPSPRKTATRS